QAFAEIERATRLPPCRFDLDYGQGLEMLMPQLLKLKRTCELLRLRALLEAQQGKPDEALATATTGFGCGRALEGEPLLIGKLVHVAMDGITASAVEKILSRADPSAAACRSLAAALATPPRDDDLVPILACERACTIDDMRRFRQDPSTSAELRHLPW